MDLAVGCFSSGPIPLKIYKYNPKNWISWVLVCVVFFIIRAGFKLQWMNPLRGKTCKTIGPLKGIANIFHSGRPICFSIKSIETSVSKVSYYAVTMFFFSLFLPFSRLSLSSCPFRFFLLAVFPFSALLFLFFSVKNRLPNDYSCTQWRASR